MNDLTVGIALGRLSTRGRCQIRVGAEWHEIELHADTVRSIAFADVVLVLQAEEVKV